MQSNRLSNRIHKPATCSKTVDMKAFFIVSEAEDVVGEGFKRP